MALTKRQRLYIITFLLSGFLFILGGISLLEEKKILLGSIQILAGLCNLIVLGFKNPLIKNKLELIILLFNIVVAITVALDYVMQGKKYLQYAWLLAAILSGIALLRMRKQQAGMLKDD